MLSPDECVGLIRSAARGEHGGNLAAAFDFALQDAEVGEVRARRWIAAIQQARNERLITDASAQLAVYETFHGGFARAMYNDPEAVTLAGELDLLQARHEETAESVALAMQFAEGWSAAHARWIAKLDQLRDARLVELGEQELVRQLGAGPVAFAQRMNAERERLYRETGLTVAEAERGFVLRNLTGHRILDDMYYLFAHTPTADECCYLIKAAARHTGGMTPFDALDWAKSLAKTVALARRWMTGARWAREADAISRDASWLFMLETYYGGCIDVALDDPVASAIRDEQDAIRARHGIEDERELDPNWYAPEEWWVLNRRWHAMIDDHKAGVFRSVGEDELADAVVAEGGDGLSMRLHDACAAVFSPR